MPIEFVTSAYSGDASYLLKQSTMSATSSEQFTLSFYVPPSSVEACKEAIFSAGAGAYPGGKYSQACFVVRGTGQFMPEEGATPNIGTVGMVEKLEEMKVETICVGRDVMTNAVDALKKAHPYEQVAYAVFKHELV